MTECTVCQPTTVEGKVVACTHFGQHLVQLVLRPGGYYSVVRFRGDFFAESHTGDADYLGVYQRQVEYVRVH